MTFLQYLEKHEKEMMKYLKMMYLIIEDWGTPVYLSMCWFVLCAFDLQVYTFPFVSCDFYNLLYLLNAVLWECASCISHKTSKLSF